MTDMTMDILEALVALPDDPSREQVQDVLSDEAAQAIMGDAGHALHSPITGYVINHSGHYTDETVRLADVCWAQINSGAGSGTLNLSLTLTGEGPAGESVPAEPGDADDLARWLRLFVPGISISRPSV